MKIEIVVQDPAGARIAHEAGADRVELCSALGVGGLSPTLGLVKACVAVGIPVHALIRPRAGGFVYTPEEVAVVASDIADVIAAGAAGVVVGALVDGGQALDMHALSIWREAAGEAAVTVHRCVDVLMGNGITPQAVAADLKALCVTRVLTSGGAPRVGEGLETLGLLTESLDGRVEVMAGGGARVRDIPAVRALRADAIHLSARMTSTAAGPTGPGGGDAAFDVTDPEQVRAAVLATRLV